MCVYPPTPFDSIALMCVLNVPCVVCVVCVCVCVCVCVSVRVCVLCVCLLPRRELSGSRG
jgi:hypothetical protein